MIGIVDYGVGNLFSLKSSVRSIGCQAVVSGDLHVLSSCDRLILPGVGAFGDAVDKLHLCGLDRYVKNEAVCGKPILGICLGMQLLFDESLEYGSHRGLGLIPGRVCSLREKLSSDYKVPHMGWNALNFPEGKEKSRLYRYVNEGDYVYFVHSFYATDCNDYVSATAEYGIPVTASAENKNVFGTQFHPEKSGSIGLSILKAFAEI